MNSDYLECPVCNEIFTKVVETPCCHRCYCYDCLKSWVEKKSDCPSCRANIASIDLCIPNIPIQRLVNDLEAECPFKNDGCKDKVTRGNLEEHKGTCDYLPIMCEWGGNKCKNLKKKDLKIHGEQCHYRPVICEKCGQKVTLDMLDSHYSTECPMYEIPCTHEHCKLTVKRSKLKEHLENECDFETIDCPYTKQGCKARFERCKLPNHLSEEALSHNELLARRLDKVEKENKILLTTIEKLQSEKAFLTSGIDALSFLKPGLPCSPLDKFPVILPSAMRDKFYRDIIYADDYKCILGIKPKSFSFGFSSRSSEMPIAVIPANRCVPHIAKFTDMPYYYEVKINKIPQGCGVRIGFVDKFHNMKGRIGSPHGFGYDVSNCCFFNEGETPKQYGVSKMLTFSNKLDGILIGCGWEQREGTVFYTIDGECQGTIKNETKGVLIPAIELSGFGVEVKINFGTEKFWWESSNWKQFREIETKIDQCSDKNICTFHVTKEIHFPRTSYQCFTCKLTGFLRACEVCARVCHKGHILSSANINENFFCDCGARCEKSDYDGSCKCLPVPPKV